MTNPPTDAELLERFATRGDEAAFRLLTERHAGLVYHTALRAARDPEMAREVSQGVFLLLARKAARLKANAGAGLAGWLHRSAVLLSRNARRAETRRLRALSILQKRMNEDATAPRVEIPHPALPHLDEALERLPNRDREVLLARFHTGRTFREIALLLGETEAAAQRRASRALEKLSALLRRRGVSVPAAALASGLSEQLKSPAPAAVFPPGAGLPPAEPASAFTSHFTQAVLGRAALLLLAGGVSGAAAFAMAAMRHPFENTRTGADKAAGTARPVMLSAASEPLNVPRSGPAGDWRVLVEKAAGDLRSGEENRLSSARAAWRLAALTETELAEALQWTAALPAEDRIRPALAAVVLGLWGNRDPGAAWAAFGAFPLLKDYDETFTACGSRLFLKRWARDPATVFAGIASRTEERREALHAAALTLHESEPDRLRWMRETENSSADAAKAKGAEMTLTWVAENMETRGETLSWIMALPFSDSSLRAALDDDVTSRIAHNWRMEPGFSRWLAGLEEGEARAVRDRLREAVPRLPERERWTLSRQLQDAELLRAVRESL